MPDNDKIKTDPMSPLAGKNRILKTGYLITRWILGVVFIVAAYDKILHPNAFAAIVNNYQILPGGMINLTALVLPWLEMIIGICLVAGWVMPGAVIFANILLLTFTVLIFYNLHRGLDISCGCFSTAPGESPVGKLTIARDTIFLLLSFYLIWFNLRKTPYSS